MQTQSFGEHAYTFYQFCKTWILIILNCYVLFYQCSTYCVYSGDNINYIKFSNIVYTERLSNRMCVLLVNYTYISNNSIW